jgi:protein involved in polysaccharide export with SLBB domain
MDGPNGPGPAASFVLQPLDVVTVAPAATPRLVHIVGDVVRPGAVELVTQDTMSLMKLIAVAGGMTNTAASDNALIMHINAEGVQTATAVVNVKKIMQGKVKDLDLIAGDIVLIPSSRMKSIANMLTSTGMNAGLTTAIFTLGRY